MTRTNPETELFESLRRAGHQGITFGVDSPKLKEIMASIKKLRLQGNQIKEQLISGTKNTPFSRRIKFVLESSTV